RSPRLRLERLRDAAKTFPPIQVMVDCEEGIGGGFVGLAPVRLPLLDGVREEVHEEGLPLTRLREVGLHDPGIGPRSTRHRPALRRVGVERGETRSTTTTVPAPRSILVEVESETLLQGLHPQPLL